MKREQITELFPNATKEQIDKIMSLNGADINSAKGELDTLKGQLSTAQGELEKLKKLKEESQGEPDKLKEAAAAIKALQTELAGMKQAETLRAMREKVSTEKKIPASLLTGETEDACNAQADAILAFAKTGAAGYPNLRDGGEHGAPPTTATRDKFAEWAKENL